MIKARHKLLYESEVLNKEDILLLNRLLFSTMQARRDAWHSDTEERKRDALRYAITNLKSVVAVFKGAEERAEQWQNELFTAFMTGEIKESIYFEELETVSRIATEAREAQVRVLRMESRLMHRTNDERRQKGVRQQKMTKLKHQFSLLRRHD